MTQQELLSRIAKGALFLDGATGSNLRAAGMPVGVCTETWILDNSDAITSLQRDFVSAGSDIVLAPTFGANSYNLGRHNVKQSTREINLRLVELSRLAVGSSALVAGDMTTLGLHVDEPSGISYTALTEIYHEQASALNEAGVDLFVIETMLGVTECLSAIEGIREVSDKPIFCTLTLDAVGASYFDGNAEEAAIALPAAGANAIGINCSYGPDMCESIVALMHSLTDLPIIAKPNAGLPTILEDGTAHYAMSPTLFARQMRSLKCAGASILGGCCGTTPKHIGAMVDFCR